MTVETIQIATECLPATLPYPLKKSGIKKNLFGTTLNRSENKKLLLQVYQDNKDRLDRYQITGVIGVISNKEKITSHELIEPMSPTLEDEDGHPDSAPKSQHTPANFLQPEQAVQETKSGKSKLKTIRVLAPYDTHGKTKQKTMKGEFLINKELLKISSLKHLMIT